MKPKINSKKLARDKKPIVKPKRKKRRTSRSSTEDD